MHGSWPAGRRPQVRLFQTPLLPTPPSPGAARGRRPPKPAPRTQIQLPPHRGNRPPNHPPSLPGPGRLGRSDRPKTKANAAPDQYSQSPTRPHRFRTAKKKLYALNPKTPLASIQTQRTRRKQRAEPADPKSLERQVRQLLADKISGNQLGLWLLVPEHLRLGTWDLLCGWTEGATPEVAPRLALQLVHEAALCVSGVRQ